MRPGTHGAGMMETVLKALGEGLMVSSPVWLMLAAAWVKDVAVPFVRALHRWYVSEWRPNRPRLLD